MGDQPPTITQLDSSPELSKVFFSMFELIVLVLWSSTASLLSSAWLPGTAFVILCFILKFCALVSYVLLFISSLCLFSHPFSSSTVITPCVFRSFPSLFLSPSVLFVMHLLFLSVSLHPCAVPRVLSCTLICTLLKLLFFLYRIVLFCHLPTDSYILDIGLFFGLQLSILKITFCSVTCPHVLLFCRKKKKLW